jgi:peptidoglycan/LPS O-acetylase OafA/YrhL
VLGVRYCADKRAQKTGTPIARLVILVVAALALRFVANVYIDGTIWYDRIIVPYTHMIAACSIFELFEIFFREREVPKGVKILSDISLEVYLFHYMFTVGPISVFDRVTFWPAACLVVTVLVLGISLLFNKVSTLISNSLSHKAIARKN